MTAVRACNEYKPMQKHFDLEQAAVGTWAA